MIRNKRVLADVIEELERARSLFPRPFINAHEGHSVVLEEFEEFQKEVFVSCKNRNAARLYNEAIQLAAMAIRFAQEVDAHAS